MNLVIVESPAKCKTIEKYLGSGYKVVASIGHIRDLPKKELGIDLDTFQAQYVTAEGKAKTISQLKKLASQAETVWLASDLDREGESIAWHVKTVLGLKQYKRIAFNEITKTALQEALKNPKDIDMGMVDSQQARRLLDRLIGWKFSGVVSNLANDKMSAGRVQSPAVRLIVEREEQINQFSKTEHYGVELAFNHDDISWSAKWETKPFFQDQDIPYISDTHRPIRRCFLLQRL
jgi:DNA topoisomerase-1